MSRAVEQLAKEVIKVDAKVTVTRWLKSVGQAVAAREVVVETVDGNGNVVTGRAPADGVLYEVRESAQDVLGTVIPVYSKFGSMGYWHALPLADDLRRKGGIEDRATGLLAAMQGRLRPMHAKALALDLAAACGKQGVPMPAALLVVLAALLDLPDDFLRDPAAYFMGRDGRGEKPGRRGEKPKEGASPRDIAQWADRTYYQKHGAWPKVSSTAEAAGCERDTLRSWRKQPDYAAFVKFR